MDDIASSIVLQWVLPICFLAMALITATFGSLLLKSQPERVVQDQTHRDIPYHRFYGFLLLASAIGWIGLGTGINKWTEDGQNQLASSANDLDQLPATAAGIAITQAMDTTDHSASATARTVTVAEELAESPRAPEFQKLRKYVTEMLFASEKFDKTSEAVRIDLAQDKHRETIKYLADERPGLLTVIYHRQLDDQAQMVVYFPEVTGNELIYTPLSGPSSSSISRMIPNR